MDGFIKKIFGGKVDEGVHRQFVRFGRGEYRGRALISLQKGSKTKVKGSFEWSNDFVELVAGLVNARFSGVILNKEEIPGLVGKKKGAIYEYSFEGNNDDVKKINGVYCILLDGEGEGIKLKMKKKIPKPGKSGEAKIDDKFCQIEAELNFFPEVKEAFFWDVPDCKKASVSHDYIINELVIPKDEKDPEQMRLRAKRKGKIVRNIKINGREIKEEKDFEA